MSEDSEPLPEGRQFALTWGLSTEFGGMTGAMLRRSAIFARLGGRPVEVLTFDARDDYPHVLAELAAAGRLPDGVTARNLWDEVTEGTLRPATAKGASASALGAFDPLPASSRRTALRRAADGTVLQLDRRRADGSLALSDRRDVRERGTQGGRSIVLCDGEGRPVIGFSRASSFYRWWLDTVVGDEDAFLLVDSKTTAPFLLDYRNRHATRVYILHNSHLFGDARPWAPVKAGRRKLLAGREDFDAFVVLSERQREDLAVLLGPSDAVAVVPNPATFPAAPDRAERDPGLGLVAASLDERKRVDHAVRAVAAARSAGADVRLDIYGDGPLRAELEHLIGELGVGGAVRLLGYRRDAADAFSTASFFLLTSRSEGFPLVLAEGMSRGCIPLSYDVSYGPADIVADGVSGFLVPPGDIDALARRLAQLTREGVSLEPMRQQAIGAAARFSEQAVLGLWRRTLSGARARSRRPRPTFEVAVRSSDLSGRRSLTAVVDFSLSGTRTAPSEMTAALALHGPDDEVAAIEIGGVGSVSRTLRHGVWRARVALAPEATAWLPPGVSLTAEVELRIGRSVQRIPLGTWTAPEGRRDGDTAG